MYYMLLVSESTGSVLDEFCDFSVIFYKGVLVAVDWIHFFSPSAYPAFASVHEFVLVFLNCHFVKVWLREGWETRLEERRGLLGWLP